jgi:hypothetical protein
MTNTNQIIKANFEALIMTMKFMVQQNSIRNINLIQKTWFSKLWYVSQMIPPGNEHKAKLKTVIGNFLWAGCLYRIGQTSTLALSGTRRT